MASPIAGGPQAPAARGRAPAPDAASAAGGLEVPWRAQEGQAAAGLGGCGWVLTTVSSTPAGPVAARGLQSVRVAESGAQALSAPC